MKFIAESQAILESGKFELRGWEHTPISSDTGKIKEKIEKVSVLGLIWTPTTDELSIDMKGFLEEEKLPVTKRKILSAAHRIFDPIGVTCPVTLEPKILLQECWRTGLSWDVEVPPEVTKKFERWKAYLNYLNKLAVPRYLRENSELNAKLSLHIFCDSSKAAFATCIFLRSESVSTITCQLIQARNRVAPLKKISIPRLELLSCTIGARLARATIAELGLENIPTFFWCDSTNALYWIKKNENWATFVYNRVQEIRKLTNPEDWRHIRTTSNAADLPSRGCNAKELIKSRWWEGPSWLKQSCDDWPLSDAMPDMDVINAEKKKSIMSATNIDTEKLDFLARISSYRKMIRVTAWILHFSSNSKKKKDERKLNSLDVEELDIAEKIILKEVQNQCFKESIRNLQTFSDSNGLLRVKSRISQRNDLEAFRYPILLPSKHNVVKKLIYEKHLELSHAGIQILMSILREEYWIIKSRKTIRQAVRECITCKRFQTRPLEVVSPPLPNDRIREAQVFEVVGVDLCGPLYLKNSSKCWVTLFTCAVFRAVHIEAITSLSTDNFILALRRFISRRGRPYTIYSDNGTNLVGASNELKSVDWEKIQEYATVKKTRWKFNPPSAPWWGGFWERLIGILKSILRKVLGRASLQFEELQTVLCDAESLINARPLTYLSEENEDLVALTPAMFLQDIKETGVPDIDLIDSTSLKKRCKYRQKLCEDLRKRFRSEYLGQLKDFSKITEKSRIKEGEVVLIGDSNRKRINWPLARITKLYPGKDGNTRVVEVKTGSGSFLRPIQRLYPMEICEVNNIRSSDLSSPTCSQDEHRDLPLAATYHQPNEPDQGRRSRYGRLLQSPKHLYLN